MEIPRQAVRKLLILAAGIIPQEMSGAVETPFRSRL